MLLTLGLACQSSWLGAQRVNQNAGRRPTTKGRKALALGHAIGWRLAMTLSQQGLLERLRAASQAASVAEAKSIDPRHGRYGQGGLTSAQVKQIEQGLLQTVRKHLAIASAIAPQHSSVVALPGLPGGRVGDGVASREGQSALAAAWKTLAEVETLRGDKDAAIAAYRQALDITPEDSAANAQLADLLESRHYWADAKAHAERALRAEPANFLAGLSLARILMREAKFAQAERAAVAAAKAPRASADDRALTWSIVGEARDRLDNTAGAFKAFTQSNQIMRQRHDDSALRSHPAYPANVRHLTQFIARPHAASWSSPARFSTPAPAFLIGFPRSGTTLLEQVLSSHSKITCLGETEYLFEALSVVLKDGDLFERVGTLTTAEIETVRATYQRIVRAGHPETDGRLIVDKHPLHIVLLPLINRIFPDAKLILSVRDPRDVVLSCYQQCFGVNVATLQFLELEKAADYFDAVMELMLECRKRLRLDVHQVEYRDVVANLEREAQKMSGFLGLPFEPAMLRFDETARKRTIASASARQVINPIYARSVGRWRRYARELAPVLPLLNKWARRLGYDE